MKAHASCSALGPPSIGRPILNVTVGRLCISLACSMWSLLYHPNLLQPSCRNTQLACFSSCPGLLVPDVGVAKRRQAVRTGPGTPRAASLAGPDRRSGQGCNTLWLHGPPVRPGTTRCAPGRTVGPARGAIWGMFNVMITLFGFCIVFCLKKSKS